MAQLEVLFFNVFHKYLISRLNSHISLRGEMDEIEYSDSNNTIINIFLQREILQDIQDFLATE